MSVQDQADSGWHLDKRVPIAIIFTIGLQTFAAAWWASNLTERVAQLEKRDTRHEGNTERLITLEVQQKSLKAGQIRIEKKLDRLLPPPIPSKHTPPHGEWGIK